MLSILMYKSKFAFLTLNVYFLKKTLLAVVGIKHVLPI